MKEKTTISYSYHVNDDDTKESKENIINIQRHQMI